MWNVYPPTVIIFGLMVRVEIILINFCKIMLRDVLLSRIRFSVELIYYENFNKIKMLKKLNRLELIFKVQIINLRKFYYFTKYIYFQIILLFFHFYFIQDNNKNSFNNPPQYFLNPPERMCAQKSK